MTAEWQSASTLEKGSVGQTSLTERMQTCLTSKILRRTVLAISILAILVYFTPSDRRAILYHNNIWGSPLPPPTNAVQSAISAPVVEVQWSDFAYCQYVTTLEYLCNSIMAFEALARLGAKADRLMMFPDDWTVDNNTSEGKLLVKARDDYGVKLVPVRVESFPGEPTWAESFTKLFAFNQTAYKRVLSLDSDSTILQPMDELFFLPSAPVAMPRAYWLESPGILSSQLVLLEPSTIEFDRVLEALGSRKPTDFDMEIVNDLYGKDCIIIPHRKYDLITGEFRYKDHATYLGSNREHWDARKAYEEAKFVHFSDWPLPKPWHLTAASDIARTQPVCKDLGKGAQDCTDREVWLEIYQDFRQRRKGVCGKEFEAMIIP